MRDRSAPLTNADVETLDWDKMEGLIPVVVQDRSSGQVLMLGYMNREALAATLKDRLATFYSRSRQKLWRKGETSSNTLSVSAVYEDCDGDALLVVADPKGPTCHLGAASCFAGSDPAGPGWLGQLARTVNERKGAPEEQSYTAWLLERDISVIAQKVGEEGLEVALAAVTRDEQGCVEEIADLLYHLTVLMEMRGLKWEQAIGVLQGRRRKSER